MNPLTYHKRLARGNAPRKEVRLRRINRETMRLKLQRASFINVPRLVKHG